MCKGAIWLVNFALLESISVKHNESKDKTIKITPNNEKSHVFSGENEKFRVSFSENNKFSVPLDGNGIEKPHDFSGEDNKSSVPSSGGNVESNIPSGENANSGVSFGGIHKSYGPLPGKVPIDPDAGWTYIGTLDKGVTNADIIFYSPTEWMHMREREIKYNANKNQYGQKIDQHTNKYDQEIVQIDNKYCRITCAHKDGFISLLDLTISIQKNKKNYRNFYGEIICIPKVVCSFSIVTWKAHEFRTINVWQLKTVPKSDDVYFNGYVLTSSLKGCCKLWGLRRGTKEEKKEFRGNKCGRKWGESSEGKSAEGGVEGQEKGDMGEKMSLIDVYELLFECVTGKEQISTCCVLLNSNCLLIGDCRGGISIIRWKNDLSMPSNGHNKDDDSDKLSAFDGNNNLKSMQRNNIKIVNLYIPHIHGDDLVSCIKSCSHIANDGFCSVGHDGMFCVFSMGGELISRMSCLPIKTPNEITLIGNGASASIYIGGYLGDMYLVWDIRRGYQVIRIEAGGWRRYYLCICVYICMFVYAYVCMLSEGGETYV